MSRLPFVLPFFLVACALSHGANNNGPDAAARPDIAAPDVAAPDVTTRPDVIGFDAGIPDVFARDSPPDIDVGPTECLIGGPSIPCVLSCGGAPIDAVCVGGVRQCPPGAIDPRLCVSTCPPAIETCSVEGATCAEGSQCGSAVSCVCESGLWSCGFAEADPVCTCGREAEAGDSCTGEVANCGDCCPTLDGPNWAAMRCVDGSWQPQECEEVACPPL